MKWKSLLIWCAFLLNSCVGNIGAGTLGGWKIITFPTTQQQLNLAFDRLYINYNQYKVPEKWIYESEYWKRGGYDFLKATFVHFENGPEEMYYVTYIGPGFGDEKPQWARIAIRAVYTEQAGWKLNEKFSNQEKSRIAKRFNDEIISKLEKLTKTKSFSEK